MLGYTTNAAASQGASISNDATTTSTCGSTSDIKVCIAAYQSGLTFTWSSSGVLWPGGGLNGLAGTTMPGGHECFEFENPALGDSSKVEGSPAWFQNSSGGYSIQDSTNTDVDYVPYFHWTTQDYTLYVPLSGGEYQGYGCDNDGNPAILGVHGSIPFDLVVGPSDPPLPQWTVDAPVEAIAATPDGGGYWLVGADGSVETFGDAQSYGSTFATKLNAPIVGITATPDSKGYWLIGADGGVFTFGDAKFYGSTGNLTLNKPVVGMASTPNGKGYWLVASDGGVFSFGDAQFYGSTGDLRLNRPVVGMAVDQATGGYWLVASDGGVFSFNAPFYGSTGSLQLVAPVVGMESSADGSGYRFVAADGGVFDFNLPFAGSIGGTFRFYPVVGMASSDTTGYWLVDITGHVTAFGGVTNYGSGT
jgi:hypothetical protein